MDDLDREIEEAARLARRRVWRGRVATLASTATFFVVGIAGCVIMFTLFPEPKVSEFDAHRQAMKEQNEEPSAMSVIDDTAAERRDRGRVRWKVAPVFAAAMGSAVFVAKVLRPKA